MRYKISFNGGAELHLTVASASEAQFVADHLVGTLNAVRKEHEPLVTHATVTQLHTTEN